MASHHERQQWSEWHARAVRQSAPVVPEFTASEQDEVWAHAVRASVDDRPRASRWRIVLASVIAAGAVGTAGAASAGMFSAHTGRGPVDAEDVELGGPGERLDLSAPDFADVVDEVTADIVFPSARERESAVSWEAETNAQPFNPEFREFVSTGAVRLWMSGHALCSWSNSWAVARSAGDSDAEEEAALVILGAREWTSITDTDSDFADESEFAWLPDLERAVRAGNPTAVRGALKQSQACMPGLAPALGLGKRW